MTPLPAAIGGASPAVAWRLDEHAHAAAWDSGIGAERMGGRWNPKGVPAVYCSFENCHAYIDEAPM